MNDLLKYRSQTVEQVVGSAVDEHLRQQTFNSSKQISGFLVEIGIGMGKVTDDIFTRLDQLTQRRHKIVHECDLEKVGQIESARRITIEQVEDWIHACNSFLLDVQTACIRRNNQKERSSAV